MTDRVFSYPESLGQPVSANFADDSFYGGMCHSPKMTNNWSFVKTNDYPLRQVIGHAITAGMKKNDRPFTDIAERIVWHREIVESLNQKEYAYRAGVTRSSLNNWESGDYRLSIDGALALRKTFGLSLDFLYAGEDETLPMALRAAWRDRFLVSPSR